MTTTTEHVGIGEHVIKVAVLVTADTRPKDLSNVLDLAFEDQDEILQFTIEPAEEER